MAQRGDVVQLRTRLGFGPGRAAEPVVVVQSDGLNAVWHSLMVVPLALPTQADQKDPTVLLISKDELGLSSDHVALTTQLRPIALDALSPGRLGRLKPSTESKLDELLRLVLAL